MNRSQQTVLFIFKEVLGPRPQQNFQRRTTSTTTTTTTAPPNLRELEEQRQVDEVMNMDPHTLADAFVGMYFNRSLF